MACLIIADTTAMTRENTLSYYEIATSIVREHQFYGWVLMFLLASVVLFALLSVLVHVEVMDIAFVAQAEAVEGANFSEEIYLPGAYFTVALNFVASVASLHGAWVSWNR